MVLFYSFSKCISLIFYNECARFSELHQNAKNPSVTKPYARRPRVPKVWDVSLPGPGTAPAQGCSARRRHKDLGGSQVTISAPEY